MGYLRRGSAKLEGEGMEVPQISQEGVSPKGNKMITRTKKRPAISHRLMTKQQLDSREAVTVEGLSDLAKKLNEKSDTLNATISTVNRKLAKLNMGVEVWIGLSEDIPFYREDDNDEQWPLRDETWLGYCKVGDTWELALKDVTVGTDEGGDRFSEPVRTGPVRSLLQSPREARVSAMDWIPSLLDSIKRKAERLIEAIDEAKQAAEKL
jgi:hypothetical protein